MAWVNWNKKSSDVVPDRGPLGVDFNCGRARAVHGRSAKNRIFYLDGTRSDLSLHINLSMRTPEVGRSASMICRRTPHAVCRDYLPSLTQPQQWKSGRHTLTAETALGLAMTRLKDAVAKHDGVSFVLPTYLNTAQVNKVLAAAEAVKLAVRGTATAPLALAAERATHYWTGRSAEGAENVEETPRNGRPFSVSTVLIVDIDDHALTGTVVRVAEDEVRSLASATFPRVNERIWKERLLDALSDRCVRQCRRDPRDSADSEQMLYDQIDDAIDRARMGQRVSFSVRTNSWYQDLIHAPSDLDGFCVPLTRVVVEDIRNLLATVSEVEPPQAVWLTHDAGRMPGLAAAIHQHMSERTSVRVLHPEAAAAAAANLIERWALGELPRTHLDTMISLPPRSDPRTAPRSTGAVRR